MPPLLVRRAVPAGERDVAVLLGELPLSPAEVTELMWRHRVFVLSDLTRPPTAPPLAAAAFRLNRPAGAARLAGIGVAVHARQRGLGQRMLSGALMRLRAEGFERVHACAAPGGAVASLLALAGFTTDHRAIRADDCIQFVLFL
jgi:ribosomal protein S18 acetylase RimI-like enzyme